MGRTDRAASWTGRGTAQAPAKKLTRAERIDLVREDCAGVGINYDAVVKRLFLLRFVQLGLCLAAGICAIVPDDGQSVPSISLEFVAALLTCVKIAIMTARPDVVFRKPMVYILDIVGGVLLLSGGATQAAYIRSLPKDPTLTASYIMAFIGGALFLVSALRIRRIYMKLYRGPRQAATPAAGAGAQPGAVAGVAIPMATVTTTVGPAPTALEPTDGSFSAPPAYADDAASKV